VFQRARKAVTNKSRWIRPLLEELETRALLSGSHLAAAVSPANPVMQPSVSASPDAARGTVSYNAQQIRTAYGINQAALPNGQQATGAGQTIAIVDAYHDPNIQSDLATFDRAMGLQAPPSLTQQQMNGVSQVDTGWSAEASLDVEWAHAVAPQANLLLVEASSSSLSDLMSAVRYAASQPGVVAVSMSWGSSESAQQLNYDSSFTTPANHIGGSGLPGGVTFVAASGDNGAWFGPEWPATSPNVLAVGGTTLTLSSTGAISSESGWSDSGGGISNYEREPAFQKGVQASGARTSPDVAYNANPYTGYQVYDSVGNYGWIDVGGTSAGAPQWAGILALADQARAANGLGSLGNGQAAVYSLPSSDFHNIATGFNGYRATAGYNLVTGLGSPVVNNIVADLSGSSPAAPASSSGSSTTTSSTTTNLGGTPTNPGGGGGTSKPTNPPAKARPHDQMMTDTTSSPASTGVSLGVLTFSLTPAPVASTTSLVDLTFLSNAQASRALSSLGGSSALGSSLGAPAGLGSGMAFNSLGVTSRGSSDLPWNSGTVSIRGVSGDDSDGAGAALPDLFSPDDMPAPADAGQASDAGWDLGPCDVDAPTD
jgi:subtilase family serine protease